MDIDQNFLGRIRIVLIRTTEAGNIGSAARAMKTMGLSRLVLVEPAEFPSAKATARASGADDVLVDAMIVESLEQALEGCDLIMGTSARLRDLPWPLLGPREGAQKVWEHRQMQGDVAVVFGCENSGMTNKEMDHCHFQIHIPANSHYSSLNLAASVQIIAYEMRMVQMLAAGEVVEQSEEILATRDEMQHFYDHFFNIMQQVGYYRPQQPKLLKRRVMRLFNRSMMTHPEVQIMRGILSMIDNKLNEN